MARSRFSRREFLHVAGFTGGAAVLAACAPQVVTQVVNQTQVVNVPQTQIVNQTQVVNQTQIVQVPVTVTPPPVVKTPQGKEMPADAAPLEKQITYGQQAEPKFLDVSRDIYTTGGTNSITEPLLRNNENIELVPALAESWKLDDATKNWVFTIRKDALWSDGQPITADDIVFTYAHAGDPKLANPWISFLFTIKGLQDYALGTGPASAIGVTKIDDRTVTYAGQLGFVPYLPQLLAYQAATYVPKHVVEANPEHWADTAEGAISSGPYICSKWDHGKEIDFDINPKYNGPHKPFVQKLVSQIVGASAPPAFNAFLNEEIDLITTLGPAELAAARADPKLSPLIHFFPNFQSTYLQVDTLHPPLDNLDFRSALAHAIDRKTLCQQVWGGT
jgi:oligopeptide transport system substrate-binding protein